MTTHATRLLSRLLAGLAAAVSLAATSPPTAAAAPPPRIDWAPCGSAGALCGRLQVPLDWARPAGPSISVGVARLPAGDPSHRVGTLFWNPGGPGAPGLGAVAFFPTIVFSAALRARFDIVGFDPRGVGSSEPAVACTAPLADPTISLFPRDREQYERLVAHNRAVGESCLQASGPALGHLDTVSGARDVDAIRTALGEPHISWLGLSYGTMLGAQYGALFPDRVQRMVLDGALDHGLSMDRALASETAAVEDEFHRFVDWCEGTIACALHGQNVTAVWDGLLTRAERQPVGAAGQQVTAEQIRYVAQFAFNGLPEGGPLLAQAIAAATNGDASFFFGLFRAATTGSIATAYRAITCLDFSPQLAGGFDQLRERIEQARQLAPHMGGSSEMWAVMASCISWPILPVDPQRPFRVADTPPILVVSNSHDDSTPLAWGESRPSPHLEQSPARVRRRRAHSVPAFGVRHHCDGGLPHRGSAAAGGDGLRHLREPLARPIGNASIRAKWFACCTTGSTIRDSSQIP
jgi:pimeloyl-ACP methyl ester carboxylesterase